MQSFPISPKAPRAVKSSVSSATAELEEYTGNCWNGWDGGKNCLFRDLPGNNSKGHANLDSPFVFHLGLESGGTAFAGVANVLRFAEIHHFLGDIGGVVADALEALGDDHQVQAAGNRFRILHHLVRKVAIDLFVQRVDSLV